MQARKRIDCSQLGGDCTVAIAGTEQEVLRLGRQHAILEHGHADGEDLERALQAMIHDELTLPGSQPATA